MLTMKVLNALRERKFLKDERLTQSIGLIFRNYVKNADVDETIKRLIEGGRVNHGPDVCPLPSASATPEQYAQYKISSEANSPYPFLWESPGTAYLTLIFTWGMKPLLAISTRKERGDGIVSKVVWIAEETK